MMCTYVCWPGFVSPRSSRDRETENRYNKSRVNQYFFKLFFIAISETEKSVAVPYLIIMTRRPALQFLYYELRVYSS